MQTDSEDGVSLLKRHHGCFKPRIWNSDAEQPEDLHVLLSLHIFDAREVSHYKTTRSLVLIDKSREALGGLLCESATLSEFARGAMQSDEIFTSITVSITSFLANEATSLARNANLRFLPQYPWASLLL